MQPNPVQPRIVPITRLAQGGKWRTESLRALPEPCLLWITRGQGRITLNGLTRGYGVHNTIFIPAHMMHAFDLAPQTMGSAVFFGGSDVPLPSGAVHLRVRDSASQAELSSLIDAVGRELASDRPSADRAAQLYLGLISVWLERQSAVQPNEMRIHGAARQLASRYSALLEEHFRTGMGVAEYAALLGVTPTHLTRSCRATSGRAASEMLQDRRLSEARRLLAETKHDVRDIAAQLGFRSAAYFTRAFHAKTGKTPTQFRHSG